MKLIKSTLLSAIGAGMLTAVMACSNYAPQTVVPSTALGQTALSAVTSPSLGMVVEDARGYTLYRFDRDSATPPTTNCTDVPCVTTWPPALAGANAPLLVGINPRVVGTVTRPDGTKQLTIAGWPVYEYAGDTAPGQTNGQGVMGIWHAVTPTGGKATATPASTNGGGY